jgi:hypothetical protein
MFILATGTWPFKSSAEMGKITIEAYKEQPKNFKRLGVYVVYGGEGVKTYTLYEIEEGKEYEGYKEMMEFITQYYEVEGYKITFEWLVPAAEALPMIGLKM